jgi:hypothetical protein
MRKYFAGVAAFATAAVVAVLAPGALAAPTQCGGPPSFTSPAAGSSVNGGLEVPSGGFCFLNNVTVNGGVTVDSGGFLEVWNGSAIHGGLSAASGAETEIWAGTPFGPGTFDFGPQSTIDGGLSISDTFFSFVVGAQINGGASFSGAVQDSAACGNDIRGGVTINNVQNGGAFFWLGDPEDAPFSITCPGNTIHGDLSVTNSNLVEVEGNSTTGSASISGSTLELNGNTINGNLSCGAGNTFLPPAGPDPTTNTIHHQVVSATSPC